MNRLWNDTQKIHARIDMYREKISDILSTFAAVECVPHGDNRKMVFENQLLKQQDEIAHIFKKDFEFYSYCTNEHQDFDAAYKKLDISETYRTWSQELHKILLHIWHQNHEQNFDQTSFKAKDFMQRVTLQFQRLKKEMSK